MKDKLLWFGSLMTLTGLLGFTTVADEFRHINELIAISAIFLFGVSLIVLAVRSKRLNNPVSTDKILWAGAILTLLGILGFGFVADDFDHMPEVFACSTVLLAGVVLLLVARFKHRLPSAR